MKHRSVLLGTMAMAAVFGLAFVASPAAADQGALIKQNQIAGSQNYSSPASLYVAAKINPVIGADKWHIDGYTMRAVAVDNNTWTNTRAGNKLLGIASTQDNMSLGQKLMSSTDYYGSKTDGFVNLSATLAAVRDGWIIAT